MTTSSRPNPEQTGLSTQGLPAIPTSREMKTWNMETVRLWIEQRHPNVVEKDDLDTFKKARIAGRAFLVFSIEHFRACGLSLPVAAALNDLADEVRKKGKFIPRT
jgi:hypothetical protein